MPGHRCAATLVGERIFGGVKKMLLKAISRFGSDFPPQLTVSSGLRPQGLLHHPGHCVGIVDVGVAH
jgi:hypothetical protein